MTDTDTKEWAPPPDRLTEDELKTLARRIVTNEVYITNTREGLDYSFGLLLAMSAPQMSEAFATSVCAMYEDLSEAGPRAINGYPMFFSGHFLRIEDWEPLMAQIGTMREALGLPPIEKQPSITCPKCGKTSFNENDIREGYCGNCHEFTGVTE